jgi:hypothetical protein
LQILASPTTRKSFPSLPFPTSRPLLSPHVTPTLSSNPTKTNRAPPEPSSSVLSDFYTNPPTVTGSALTALATALESVQSTWTNSPQFTSAIQAVYSAAPKDAQSAIATLKYTQITAQPWWTAVPDSAKAVFSSESAALDSVAQKILGTPTASKNLAPRETVALAAAVAGVVGLVGAMVAL